MASLFWVCWMMNTIRKVMMVVPVLMTSTASIKAKGLPAALVTVAENLSIRRLIFFFRKNNLVVE